MAHKTRLISTESSMQETKIIPIQNRRQPTTDKLMSPRKIDFFREKCARQIFFFEVFFLLLKYNSLFFNTQLSRESTIYFQGRRSTGERVRMTPRSPSSTQIDHPKLFPPASSRRSAKRQGRLRKIGRRKRRFRRHFERANKITALPPSISISL